MTLTATVAPASGFTGTPTGTVTFLDGTTTLGTGTLNSSGVATLATTGLIGGLNALTARYNTDNNFATSVSPTVSVTLPQGSSTTALAINPNPSSFGESVTLTATVTGIGGGALLPTGTVQFFAGATSLGTAAVNSGIASLQTTSLPLGTTSVVADYLGTSSFSASVSPVVVAVVSLATTGVSVTASIPNPGPTQTEVLTATVASGLAGNTPTGTVDFFANGVDLGSATLTNGVATLTLKGVLPVGNQFITAQYLGDANNAPALSAALPLPVGTAFVQYLNGIYVNTLGRPINGGQIFTINTSELSAWLTKFVQGGAQRRPIVEAILHSKETRQFGVQATYTHLANKQAAHPQLANAFVGANGTTLNLHTPVLGGPAYFAAAGSTVSGFLAALGTDVLGTPLPDATLPRPSPDELNHGVSAPDGRPSAPGEPLRPGGPGQRPLPANPRPPGRPEGGSRPRSPSSTRATRPTASSPTCSPRANTSRCSSPRRRPEPAPPIGPARRAARPRGGPTAFSLEFRIAGGIQLDHRVSIDNCRRSP